MPGFQLVNHYRLTLKIFRAIKERNQRLYDLENLTSFKFVGKDLVQLVKKHCVDKTLRSATENLSLAEGEFLSTKLLEAVFENGNGYFEWPLTEEELEDAQFMKGKLLSGFYRNKTVTRYYDDKGSSKWTDVPRNGDGHLEWRGQVYTGQFRNGHFHGNGTLFYPSGANYTGEFSGGQWDGRGRINLPMDIHNHSDASGQQRLLDDSVYTGEFKEGRPHGRGRFNISDLAFFVGDFVNGVIEGNGTMTYADGSVYVGSYIDGAKNGFGTLTNPSKGYVITGNFVNGTLEGVASITLANGDAYYGQMKNYTMDGQGTFVEAGGNIYSGQWRAGFFEGLGQYTHALTGQVYEGEFQNDWEHFNGTLTLPDGRNLSGVREGEIFVADSGGIFVTSGGIILEGDFHMADPISGNGNGKLPNGIMINGTMVNGL